MNRTTIDKMTHNDAFDPVEAEAALASLQHPTKGEAEPTPTSDHDLVETMMDYIDRETAHVDPFPAGD
jgi:hypothetical protein